jgi:hypothetical protein
MPSMRSSWMQLALFRASVERNVESVAGNEVGDDFVALPGFAAEPIILSQLSAADAIAMGRPVETAMFKVAFLRSVPMGDTPTGGRITFWPVNDPTYRRRGLMLKQPDDSNGSGDLWITLVQQVVGGPTG